MLWSHPEEYRFELSLGGLTLRGVGFQCRREDGVEAFGSAAGVDEDVSDRARFELRERMALIEASEKDSSFFPVAPAGASYSFARSNGVAAGADEFAAMRSAYLELAERESVLRAWFEGRPFYELPHSDPACEGLKTLRTLGSLFEIRIGVFSESPASVVGCFFIERSTGRLFHGFGAAFGVQEALKKAEREVCQSLVFLHGEEEIPGGDVPPPLQHQLLWNSPQGGELTRLWFERASLSKKASASIHFEDCSWVRISAVDANPVYKAIHDGTLPLVFGSYDYRTHLSVQREDTLGALHPIQ